MTFLIVFGVWGDLGKNDTPSTTHNLRIKPGAFFQTLMNPPLPTEITPLQQKLGTRSNCGDSYLH